MQTLATALHDQDFGHLRIIAELWGLDLSGGTAGEAADNLARSMLDGTLLAEVIDSLSTPAREALHALLRNQGRLALTDLTRKFGPLRQMGPGRRDREQPWRIGTSAIEALWYRGLVARAFMDTPTGPQEFGYIPRDLAALMRAPEAELKGLRVQPIAQPDETRSATDVAVDDLVTLLAALRRQPATAAGLSPDRLQALQPFLYQPHSARLLLACLIEDHLLVDERLTPDPEAVRAFLDCSRSEILKRVRNIWRESRAWNDLAQVPHLRSAGGEWPNDPLVTRRAILDFLNGLTIGEWWDLSDFIQVVHDTRPGFQRPAGDFDSWYLQDTRTGSFVRGLAHWHAVEGSLIYGIITGPLHWLGMLDLGSSEPSGPAIAFRLTPGFDPASEREAPASTRRMGTPPPTRVLPDGVIIVPRYSSPALRYQIARISAWESRDTEGYRYRLTPDGLALASSQGLQPSHVRAILEGASGSPLPRSLAQALERWSARGTQARLERLLVFRVEHPDVLQELRANRSTARFLRQELGPRSVCVAEKDWRRLCEAAARLGILIEPPDPPGGTSG
jgi:hypothetical protein